MKQARNQLTKRIIFVIVLVCILSLAIVKIIGAFKGINEQLAKKQYFTKALSSDDSSLFKSSAWASLKVTQVFHLEEENPLSFLSYNGVFDLTLYKFDMKEYPDLPKSILFEKGNAVMTTGAEYYTFPVSNFLTYKFEPRIPNQIGRLHLTLNGDSLKYNSSNTVMTFDLLCKNISIRCDESETVQIFATGNEGLFAIIEPAALELKFLARGRSIYMLMLTPRDKKNRITSDLLKSILN